jgi:hypothetical protein
MRKNCYIALAAALVLFSCDTGSDGGDDEKKPPPPPVNWEWTQYVITELKNYLTVNTIAYMETAGFIAGTGTDYNIPVIAISPNGEEDSWEVREINDVVQYDSFAGKIRNLGGKLLMTRGSGVHVGLVSDNNGATWTERGIGLGTKGHTYSVDKGDKKFYLVSGQHGQAAWSDDGMETWTVLTKETTTFDNGSASQLYINAAAYGNGRFVLGGGRGHTAVSTDGKTWTGAKGNDASDSEAIFDGPSGFIDTMLFANGKFVALGGMDGQETKSAWSIDGVNWTQGGDPGLRNGSDSPRMTYGGGYIVAVDNMGQAAYSTDEGLTWTATETGFGITPVKDVAYGNGRFVIVGSEGKAAYYDIP